MNSLTPTQYETAKAKAMKSVEKHIGDKPERAKFAKEHGSLFDVLDVIAFVIFLAALLISSTHIIALMANQSEATHKSAAAGIQISAHLYTVIHQLGMIFLAELSAILFLVMFNMSKNKLFLGMAVLAALFVFGANLASGLNVAIAIMPPVFTLGIGYRLEIIITEYLRRRGELDERYNAALNQYESAIEDPATHPAYIASLRAEVWRSLASKNKLDADTPPEQKLRMVTTEIKRHAWTDKAGITEPFLAPNLNGHHEKVTPIPVAMN